MNATFGTAAELILLFALLRAGQIVVVKAALMRSILASMVLVVGLSRLTGGAAKRLSALRQGRQRHGGGDDDPSGDRPGAACYSWASTSGSSGQGFNTDFQGNALDALSMAIAVILLLLYCLLIAFQFRQPSAKEVELEAAMPAEARKLSLREAVGLLVAATVGIAIVSEILSGAVDPFGQRLDWTHDSWEWC